VHRNSVQPTSTACGWVIAEPEQFCLVVIPEKEGCVILEEHKRSITKAVTYRLIIIALDVTAVFLFTGRLDIAVGFMIVSNVYVSIAYYLHERLWNKTNWGKKKERVDF
jgi:adenylylsulfate kinase